MILLFTFLMLQSGIDAGPAGASCDDQPVTLEAFPIMAPENYQIQWDDADFPGRFLVVTPAQTTTYRVTLTDLDTSETHSATTRVLVHPGSPDLNLDGVQDDEDWAAFYPGWNTDGAPSDFDPDGDNRVTILDWFYICNHAAFPVNTPPTLFVDDAVTYRDELVNLNYILEDAEQIPSLRVVQPPENGIAFVLSGNLRYSPNLGFLGRDNFTLTATDGHYETDPLTVEVEVIAPDTWVDLFNDIFNVTCRPCHVEAVSGGLSLSTFECAQMGGINGAAFIPGFPENSILYNRVSSDTMPPFPPTLDFLEKERIRLWILKGAESGPPSGPCQP